MSDTIRVGFIGCGLIARSHARGLARVPGVAIGPVFDTDRRRADEFAGQAGTTAVVVDTAAEVARAA
ncbi:MAG: gfo/Idh/MocA family oxidoreductase, partial [Actinomycetota bacterium]